MSRIGWLFLLAACEPKGTGLGDDTSGTTDTVDPAVAPVIQTITLAQCSPNSDDVDTWSVTVAVSDPQGSGTLAAVGSKIDLYVEDVVLDTIVMACGDDACTGSWIATSNNVYCDTEAIFRFIVFDQDGNASAPYEYDPA